MASVAVFSDECVLAAMSVKSGKLASALFVLDQDHFQVHSALSHNSLENASCQQKWQSFLEHLPKEKCAYCFVNFSYISPSDNVERTKVIFVYWAPDRAKMKEKMVTAFSVNGILNKIGEGGISARLQAESLGSLDYSDVVQQVLARATVK
jgi:cofilin